MSLLPGVEVAPHTTFERRSSDRYPGPFRAVVRGITAEGGEFVAAAEVRDVSAGGAYLRIDGRVAVGSPLTVEVLVTAGQQGAFSHVGEVIRAEPLLDGRLGVAVRFDRAESVS